ncbi:DUF2911 domain-containing protein [candidate division KSB1 bacterium]
MMKKPYIIAALFVVLCCGAYDFTFSGVEAQIVPEPRVSPRAELKQRVYLTDISINYHRPSVKGRTIFGELEAYGEVWRAGANENTTIEFTDDVEVNGNPVPQGKYGIHMIPDREEWTIILSKDNVQWGSYSYDQNNDLLRITARPQTVPHVETLMYSVDSINETDAVISMSWAATKVSFNVEVPRKK